MRVTVDTVPVSQQAGASPDPGTAASARDESPTITTSNGAVSMALADDRIVVRLSDATLDQVRREMTAEGGRRDSTSLGGRIEGMVKSAVEGALSKEIDYPLAEIEDVRYEDGTIRFTFRGRGRRMIEQTQVDDRPLLESFEPADARRFVDAVKRRLTGGQ